MAWVTSAVCCTVLHRPPFSAQAMLTGIGEHAVSHGWYGVLNPPTSSPTQCGGVEETFAFKIIVEGLAAP